MFASRITTTPSDVTLSLDWAAVDEHRITVDQDFDITNMTGAVDGQQVIIKLTHTGFTATLSAANVRLPDAIPVLVFSNTVGMVDKLIMIYDADDSKFDVINFVKGLA
jgi:hypothetical protein